MLGASTVEMEEVKEKETKVQMAEATLVDGTEVYTEGELETGAILFVRAGEGVSEDPFAPAGIHETTDGLLITVGENGEITAIEDQTPEVAASEEEKKEVEMEEVDEKKEDKEFDADSLLDAMMEALKPYTEEVKEKKEKLTILSERFEAVADEPAAKKVRNTFSENLANKQTTAEARLERLIQIRKGKK